MRSVTEWKFQKPITYLFKFWRSMKERGSQRLEFCFTMKLSISTQSLYSLSFSSHYAGIGFLNFAHGFIFTRFLGCGLKLFGFVNLNIVMCKYQFCFCKICWLMKLLVKSCYMRKKFTNFNFSSILYNFRCF